jgi:Gpi18-like mannosyltransferase
LRWPALAILLLVAVAVRVALIGFEGHSGDVLVIHRWAERMADLGPWGFYENTLSAYPALLYVYWPMGLLLDGQALDAALKGLSIPFDLGIGLVLWLLVRRRAGDGAALAAAALYLFNPGVLIAGPMWGQIDAAGTLVFLGALLATSSQRWALAGALGVVAGMIKPQFGLVLLPVMVAAFQASRHERRVAPLTRSILAGGLAYVLLAAPLLLDPLRYADQLYEVARVRPMVSLFALNPWGLLVGFEVPDDGLALIGLVLLMIGLAAACVPVWRRRDVSTLLVAGVLVVFAFYFLPTRAHERYLFPAMALLAPFAVVSWRCLAAYAVLGLAFAASLLHALSYADPDSVPRALGDRLQHGVTVWAMGLLLIGSAFALVWLLTRGAGKRLEASAPRG